MNANQFMQHLEKLDACDDAKEWAKGKSWQEVYDTCHRGDWLLWLYRKSKGYDFQKLTLAKGLCANTVRHLMKDNRSIKAVDAAIAFGNGEISREEFNAAADAAAADTAAYAAHVAATYATDTAAAFVAADAAADAADASAAYVASAAAAAFAAADAAYADAAARKVAFTAYAAARKENWQKTADIVREVLPFEIWEF